MITIGRIFGWIVFSASIIIAFAEKVLAFNNKDYSSIPTSDLWVLIAGKTPDINNFFVVMILQSPIWVFIAVVGLILIFFCKKERRKSSFD